MVEQPNWSRPVGFDPQADRVRGGLPMWCRALLRARRTAGGRHMPLCRLPQGDRGRLCRLRGLAAIYLYVGWSGPGVQRAQFLSRLRIARVPPVQAIAEVMIGALDDAPGDLRATQEGWTIRRKTGWRP